MTGTSSLEGLRTLLVDGIHEMRQLLSLGIALKKVPAIRVMACEDADLRTFGLGEGSGCMIVDHQAAIVSRSPPTGSTPSIRVLLGEPWATRMRAIDGFHSSDHMARSAFQSLFETSGTGTRATMRSLLQWAPLLEQSAYRLAAIVTSLIEAERTGQADHSLTRRFADEHDGRRTWGLLELLARLTLLATTDGSGRWLAPMARTFQWANWTPGFPLARERSLWLTAVSIRSAAAFGPDVVDLYEDALLRSNHPVKLVDSLTGLAAIGVAHPASRVSVEASIRSAQPELASGEMADLAAAASIHALRVIRHPSQRIMTGMDVSFRRSFAVTDPLAEHHSELAAFKIIPAAIAAKPWMFLPPSTATNGGAKLSDGDLSTLFERAWTPDSASRTVQ